jgi:hypothetical protein
LKLHWESSLHGDKVREIAPPVLYLAGKDAERERERKTCGVFEDQW